ncbi:LemA family protein [Candidatus Pacearchaeota archaeon]|nr:LemA family protein [Candidatus Pacearchaeota archaeon]
MAKGISKKAWTWIVVAVIVLVLIFWVAGSYNRFISMDQAINGRWSEVENQYQRQADLIPNLVSVVSSSVSVETKFVKDVIAARTSWQNAHSVQAKDTAGVQMANGLVAFVNAVAENYPVLQANAQYVALTDELSGTQNRITTARGRYIEAIQQYNIAVRRFPSNILAGIFGFTAKDYYQADVASMTTPGLGTGQLPQ